MHSLFDEDCIFEAPEFHQKSSIVNKLAKSPTGGAFFFVVAWLKNSKIISGKKHHYPEAFAEITPVLESNQIPITEFAPAR